MSELDKKLKEIEKIEQKLHKQIDDEVKREDEINEIAQYTARQLSLNPMVPFSIDGREFLLVAAMYNDAKGNRCIQLVAREKTILATPTRMVRLRMNRDVAYCSTAQMLNT